MTTETTSLPIYCDRELARRLERTEARANAEFVEARAEVAPSVGAGWIDVAGTYALFDGVGSPLTQTFGLGVFDPITATEVERMEDYFFERGADVCHEVCSLVDPSLLALLSDRGYRPIELSSVLCRPIDREIRLEAPRDEALRTRHIVAGEEGLWARVTADGWRDVTPELGDYLSGLDQINAHRPDTHCFVAELEGQAVAAGGLSVFENVGLLAGACTIAAWRRRGAQTALLEHRLRFAAGHGCDLAMVVTQPGSASQRNAERQGFRVAYTRIKWRLAAA